MLGSLLSSNRSNRLSQKGPTAHLTHIRLPSTNMSVPTLNLQFAAGSPVKSSSFSGGMSRRPFLTAMLRTNVPMFIHVRTFTDSLDCCTQDSSSTTSSSLVRAARPSRCVSVPLPHSSHPSPQSVPFAQALRRARVKLVAGNSPRMPQQIPRTYQSRSTGCNADTQTCYKQVVNPTTGEKIGEVAEASPKDVDRAVEAAQKAYDTVWGVQCTGQQRGKYLIALAEAIEAEADEIAAVEVSRSSAATAPAPGYGALMVRNAADCTFPFNFVVVARQWQGLRIRSRLRYCRGCRMPAILRRMGRQEYVLMRRHDATHLPSN